ncbi:exopolyphosphatase [Microbacterium sp. No. 7]|nr:exopolyphosphatase [Microbacterium sp. No. 7]
MTTSPIRRPVRIANVSGFYGDRVQAAAEMLEGGEIDVLTGDYLAELTMYILHKSRQRDPDAGYAATFLTQMEQILGTCLDRRIRVVANAGGLNPRGLATRLEQLAARLGLSARIAWTDGDDVLGSLAQLQRDGHELRHLDTGRRLAELDAEPVTANAYLGAWPIARGLEEGADVIVTGRVTDASVVVGPAAWWHGWGEEDWDRLAGAVVAGHLIECSTQVTGGNFSFLADLREHRMPGYPIAEIEADGSSVITKNPGTGGLVSVDTVCAQLLYEIGGPAYGGPDVTTWFDAVTLLEEAPDRVRVSGTRGTPPAGEAKVAVNYQGGYRNTMTLGLTAPDIEQKAALAETLLWERLGGRDSFDGADVRLLSSRPDADVQADATAHLTVTVKDRDPKKVGRRFSNAVLELILGGYAGAYATTPPSSESAFGVYWPTLIPAAAVTPTLHLDDGSEKVFPLHPGDPARAAVSPVPAPEPPRWHGGGETIERPLGVIAGTRSGDKGGNANVGVWTRTDAEYAWLHGFLTAERFQQLLPETKTFEVRRYELPNLRALNFVVVGLLGDGVASSTRPDAQAKGLGEFLRSRPVPVPRELLEEEG